MHLGLVGFVPAGWAGRRPKIDYSVGGYANGALNVLTRKTAFHEWLFQLDSFVVLFLFISLRKYYYFGSRRRHKSHFWILKNLFS